MHPLLCCCGTSRRWLLFSHVSVWLTWGRREWEALKIGSVIKDLDAILEDCGVDPKRSSRHFATRWFSWLGAAARWCGAVENLRWMFLPQKHFRMRKGWRLERVRCPRNGSASGDFSVCRLDTVLYRKCQGDASRLCHTHGWNETSELMPPGAVFSCLYRHAYRTEEQGRRVSAGPQPSAAWFVLCAGCNLHLEVGLAVLQLQELSGAGKKFYHGHFLR